MMGISNRYEQKIKDNNIVPLRLTFAMHDYALDNFLSGEDALYGGNAFLDNNQVTILGGSDDGENFVSVILETEDQETIGEWELKVKDFQEALEEIKKLPVFKTTKEVQDWSKLSNYKYLT